MSRRVAWLLILALMLAASPLVAGGGGSRLAVAQEQEQEQEQAQEQVQEEEQEAAQGTEESVTAEEATTEEETDESTEAQTDTPSGTPVAEPTETETPAETPSEEPEASPAASPVETEEPVQAAALSDIQITLSCRSNPELTRIDNFGDGEIEIISIATLYDVKAYEPIVVNRKLGAGRTVIFRSGSGASYGTFLTWSFIYTNTAFELDGAEIVTSAGTITKACPDQPPPPTPPTRLSVSIACNTSPETTTVTNVGDGPATLARLWTTWSPTAAEPFSLGATLDPGQSITYRSGSGGGANKLTNQEIFTDAAGTAEKVYVQSSTGKKFARTCPPGPKRIEINLSTQYLIAWEGYTRVRETYVSTGKPGFDTPTGTFYVNTKLYSQTMSGCLQGECYYVPDVPFVMYFTNVGHAIHGAYWHSNFGNVMSHGCINLPVWFSEWLYYWTPMWTPVVIHY